MKKKNYVKYSILMFISALLIVVFGLFLIFIVNLVTYEPEQPAILVAEPIPVDTVASYEPRAFDEPKNIFVTVRPYGNVSEVNVREEPSISSRLVGTVEANTEFIAGEVYETEDFYGFSDIYGNKFDVESDDGIIWISKYYASYSVAGYPEDIDDTNGDEVYVKYDNDHYVVRLSFDDEEESVNVRSCPYTGGYNAYGKLMEGDFYVTTVYQIEGDYLWYGFKADEVAGSNLFFQTKRGNIDEDPDGIVWVSSRYIETIIQN